MSDYIKRSDAVSTLAEQWLFEASVENPHITDYDIEGYENLARDLFADIPSQGDLVSRAELFNKLSVVNAPMEANEYKAEVYKIINEL